jgi:hypothetical protein
MRALLLFALLAISRGGGLKLAGVPLPFIYYAVGPFGEGRPGMPDIVIEPPGFGDVDELP